MKIKAKENGQCEFEGTAKQIVLQMTRQDFICRGKNNYMQEVKERLMLVYEKEISFPAGDYSKFLKELDRVEMIEIIS